jgi:Polyketide cyclase / dehydrase and lipid transport
MAGIHWEAPVVGASEIEIEAAPEAAWDVLTAIGLWPEWNPDVTSVSVDDALQEGTEFRWKAGAGTITSTIQHVDAPRRIVWTGTSLGIKAIHVHTFEGRSLSTLVRTEESFDGLLARLFRSRLQRTLDTTLENELRHLKAEVELRR